MKLAVTMETHTLIIPLGRKDKVLIVLYSTVTVKSFLLGSNTLNSLTEVEVL